MVSPAPAVTPTRQRAVHPPVVPVRSFMAVVIGDVEIIHLPRALIIGQVSPLDQVMDVSIFVEAAARKQRSVWSSSLRSLKTLELLEEVSFRTDFVFHDVFRITLETL